MKNLTKEKSVICETIPYLTDKMVIDLVNGVAVTGQLNTTQKNIANDFIARNLDMLSGKSLRRQANINDNIVEALQACASYLEHISSDQTKHAQTIIKLNDSLKNTRASMAEMGGVLIDITKQVSEMEREFSERLAKLELESLANRELEYLLSEWRINNFSALSPMGQSFVVLDTLNRGNFGLYLTHLDNSSREKTIKTLINKMIATQCDLLNSDKNEDFLKKFWLTPTNPIKSKALADEMEQALVYQGDWSAENPEQKPMVFTATQFANLDGQQQQTYNRLVVDMIDIERVNTRMAKNIFGAKVTVN